MFAELIGAAATVGFASLGLLSLLVGTFALTGFVPAVLQTEDRLIPKLPTVVTDDERDALYKRTRNPDDVQEYVDVLTQLGMTEVGKTFKFATYIATVDLVDDAGAVVGTDTVEYLTDSADEGDESDVTVRAAKRRYRAAAKTLGFDVGWKQPKGWLIGRIIASRPVSSVDSEGSDEPVEAAPPVPATTVQPVAPAAPTAPVAAPTSIASAPANGPRRVVRRAPTT